MGLGNRLVPIMVVKDGQTHGLVLVVCHEDDVTAFSRLFDDDIGTSLQRSECFNLTRVEIRGKFSPLLFFKVSNSGLKKGPNIWASVEVRESM